MRIELRDEQRRRIGRIEVDASLRPTRVTVVPPLHNESNPRPSGTDHHEVFLNWDKAVDDAGHLRKCVACECTDLFREKAFPQVTGFVVVLAFVGAVVGLLGLATTPPMLFAMSVVLVVDVAILLFTRRRLVCYRCRTSYHRLPIARYHRSWDRSLADRHPGTDHVFSVRLTRVATESDSVRPPAAPPMNFSALERVKASPTGPSA